VFLFNFVNYVLLLLCLCILIVIMFRSVYSVSLCCSVYCLCVNVYCTVLLTPGVKPIAIYKYIYDIYHIIYFDIMYHLMIVLFGRSLL